MRRLAPRFSGVMISLDPVIWLELARAVISEKYSGARKKASRLGVPALADEYSIPRDFIRWAVSVLRSSGNPGLLIFQDLKTVHPMIAKLESQKWHRCVIDLTLRWSMSKISSAKKLHLFLANVVYHRRGFLFRMNAEASEESRKPDHLESCLLRPQQEVPV